MWKPYAVVTVVMVLVAGAGMLSTDIGPWYRQLNKPSWQPPDWLFGPAWTTIYIGIIAAFGMVWNRTETDARSLLITLLVINLVLNVLWSWLFFKIQRPDLALVEVAFLWFSIVLLMLYFFRVHPTAGWLLLPYLAWVSFASFLNYTIVRLNAPFVTP